ncbi:sodium/glutamate symporter [uncultured Ilyobacter sp.]|uniref:sodium/glutamate symporter n=1 Tax=uncultured Ilyobacter sp. TaxID=544433 RepID=UPI0029C7548E|nr:sodium/glutamate symporter [uncultured Ilyobacter sp.]
MLIYKFDMMQTLTLAAIVLLVGRAIKHRVPFFEKFFIPSPVIGGVLYSIITLIGHSTQTFEFTYDGALKTLFMIAFFTTIGFAASFKLLKKGGIQVGIFLALATVLVILQNVAGISMAKAFGLHPLMGLAVGSVPLTGGHGTSGAFGPILEAAGADGALAVAIASATFGLVAGCMIGGPIGKRLMNKFNLKPTDTDQGAQHVESIDTVHETITETTIMNTVYLITLCMGFGTLVGMIFKKAGIVLPSYIGPMLVAAIIRNIYDAKGLNLHHKSVDAIGNISLSLFLAMALMTMRLWDLAALAIPLVVMLVVQTLIMATFAYFVTYNIMGRDYDGAVMACGHCGFGMGATPNAMANMESFTAANYPSAKSFFVLPLVGALFIDFFNASIITFFVGMFGN